MMKKPLNIATSGEAAVGRVGALVGHELERDTEDQRPSR